VQRKKKGNLDAAARPLLQLFAPLFGQKSMGVGWWENVAYFSLMTGKIIPVIDPAYAPFLMAGLY
jgi:hypothetical protein